MPRDYCTVRKLLAEFDVQYMTDDDASDVKFRQIEGNGR